MATSVRFALVSSAGIIVVVVASCGFDPLIADGAFACSPEGACPTGYVCKTDSRCYRPGAGPADAIDGGTDAAEDGTSSGSTGPFVIGGSVTGLAGKGLVLQDVGTDDLPIEKSGAFAFATRLPSGALYNVNVSSQPSEPSQICTVAKGAGTVAGADVNDVEVACVTESFTIGGTVVGLGAADSGLVLQNNAGDDLAVAPNATSFTFGAKIASGSTFAVSVKDQPTTGGPCVVSGGTGTVGVTDVTSVVVNCTPNTYTVGGSVSGLNGTVVLQNNGTNDLNLTSNGSYAFSQPIAKDATYAVTVKTEPAYPPLAQTCKVANATGTMGTANLTNVNVTCAPKKFTIGGSVTGLNGTLVLANNGGDDLTVTAAGPFTFETSAASGTTYSVKVRTQPAGQVCTVASGNGTVTNANVTNVAVSCTAADPGILCGGTYCNPASKVCCPKGADGKSAPSCENKNSVPCKEYFTCDSRADCASSAGTICCGAGDLSKGKLKSTACIPQQSCTGWQICDPEAGSACSANQCKLGAVSEPAFAVTEYGTCQ